jgi:hypothetical protein
MEGGKEKAGSRRGCCELLRRVDFSPDMPYYLLSL